MIGFAVVFTLCVFAFLSVDMWYPVWFHRVVESTWFPFLPTFFGVLAAFLFRWLADRLADYRARTALLKALRVELRQARERLSELVGHTVPTDSWKLAIYSGRALLLKHEVFDEMGKMYFALENYDYEIKLVRGFSEDARKSVGMSDQAAKEALAGARWEQAVKMQKSLIEAIDRLLERDFWPKD
jgi:hypothetical protein